MANYNQVSATALSPIGYADTIEEGEEIADEITIMHNYLLLNLSN